MKVESRVAQVERAVAAAAGAQQDGDPEALVGAVFLLVVEGIEGAFPPSPNRDIAAANARRSWFGDPGRDNGNSAHWRGQRVPRAWWARAALRGALWGVSQYLNTRERDGSGEHALLAWLDANRADHPAVALLVEGLPVAWDAAGRVQ